MSIDKLELVAILVGFLEIFLPFFIKKPKVTKAISFVLVSIFVSIITTIVFFFLLATPAKKEEVNKNVYNTEEELMNNVFFTNNTEIVRGDEYAFYQIETTWKWIFLERKTLSEHIIEWKEPE